MLSSPPVIKAFYEKRALKLFLNGLNSYALGVPFFSFSLSFNKTRIRILQILFPKSDCNYRSRVLTTLKRIEPNRKQTGISSINCLNCPVLQSKEMEFSMKLTIFEAAQRLREQLAAKQQAFSGGVCQSCRRKSLPLLNGFCADCLTPCDVQSGLCTQSPVTEDRDL